MGFFKSFFLPLEAFKLIRKDPLLWRLTLISAVVCSLCFVLLGVGLWYGAPAIVSLLWTRPDSWTAVFWYLMAGLLFVVGFVVGAQTLPVILLAPLSERLSIQTETTLGVREQQGGIARFVVETGRSLWKALLRVTMLVGGHTLLLTLWLVPGYGHAVWSAAAFAWNVVWLAFEYIDVTANRHGVSFMGVVRFLNDHGLSTLGLGAAIYFLLWVPILNVFFVPIAVVSATLLFNRSAITKSSVSRTSAPPA